MNEFMTGVAALIAVVAYALIAHRMRNQHPQEWGRLGSPNGLHDPTDLGSINLAEYIWKARWIRLQDPLLILFCVAFYASVVMVIVGFFW